MRTLICFSLSSTLRPRSVVASLTQDELRAGKAVSVLDVSDFSYVRQDLPPAWFMKLCGHQVNQAALEDFFSDQGVPFVRLKAKESGRALPEHVNAALTDAALSELITYMRDDSPNMTSFFVRTTKRRIEASARPVYWALRNYLTEHRPEKILIPNGRVAHQRLLIAAATDEGVSIDYYEIGRAMPLSYYRGPFQVHDRIGTQGFVAQSTAALSDTQCESIAKDWLALRMERASPTNPYSSRWSVSNYPEAHNKSRQRLVFFTSSVDEFASYGAEWLGHEWASQFDAFAAILRKIDARSVECVLRIHPNLINKGRGYIRDEVRRVTNLCREFPHLIVFWHTNSVNSYELLKSADMVIVGRSTLGLEGSCLGKSVWTTTAARYDEYADVKRLLSTRDLEQSNLQAWEVDQSRAWRFVASWVVQDYPISVGEEHWSSFDSARPPLCARIGTLLVKNSLLHRLHLIKLVVRSKLNVLLGIRMERRGHVKI